MMHSEQGWNLDKTFFYIQIFELFTYMYHSRPLFFSFRSPPSSRFAGPRPSCSGPPRWPRPTTAAVASRPSGTSSNWRPTSSSSRPRSAARSSAPRSSWAGPTAATMRPPPPTAEWRTSRPHSRPTSPTSEYLPDWTFHESRASKSAYRHFWTTLN